MASKQKQNTIHIRLDYSEALNSKKSFLASELNAIKLSRIMKRYWLLRAKECTMKQQLKIQLSQLKTHLGEILKDLPEPELPRLLKEGRKRGEMLEIDSIVSQSEQDFALEKELKEIQKKLAELQ